MSDTTQLTTEKIAQYRVELADNTDALAALDVIEECEGNLQDAIILMRMRETGTEPDKSLDLLDLDELATKCRPFICSAKTKKVFKLIGIVAGCLQFPVTLVVPVVLFVVEDIGLDAFCKETD